MEAVGQLAGGVAHDFNNLLTVIIGYSRAAAAQRCPPDDPLRGDAGRDPARPASARPALTRQLLAFSRKQVLQPRGARPQRVVADMETMLRRLIGEDIELVPSLDAGARAGQGRPRPDRAGDHEPGGQRARRHARRRPARRLDTATSSWTRTAARPPDLAAAGAATSLLAVSDTGTGMDAETERAHLRAVLHHQGAGQGHGPRALHRLRHREAERRPHLGLQRARPRHHVHASTCRGWRSPWLPTSPADAGATPANHVTNSPAGGRRARGPASWPPRS